MAALLLTGGRVVDPANRLDVKADVLILEGKILDKGLHIPIKPSIYEPVLRELAKESILFTETHF